MSENHASPRPTPKPFCSVYGRLLPMLHMGLLSAEERADVEAHLAECAWCQNQLATYDILDAALRRQFAGETVASPAAAPHTRPTLSLEEIMQASNQRPATTPPPAPSLVRPRNPRLSTLGAVAAVLVLTVLVASLFAYFGSRGGAPASHPTPTPPLTTPPTLPPFDLGQHLLATAVLDIAALLIAALICVALGVLARSRPRAATAVIETIRPLSMAVPTYVLGPLLLFIFAFSVHPPRSASGQLALSDPRQLVLPALTLAIGAVALTLAQVRSGIFTFSRADGSWAVIGLYLLGATVSGTFVVETIFGWSGIGSAAITYGLFFVGSAFQDLGTFWGIVLLTAIFYLVVALPVGVATGFLAQRAAVTGSEPGAPSSGRAVPRWVSVTLLSAGVVVVAALVLAIIFAPHITPYYPSDPDLTVRSNPPSGAHLLGTDDIGRDILSQLLYSGRVSLGIGAISVGVAAVSGLALGALLGLILPARRRTSVVVDGVLTALSAFPAMALALALAVALQPSFTSLVVAFTIAQVPTFMRLGMTLMRTRRPDTAGLSRVAQGPFDPKVFGLVLAQASISMAIVLVGVSALTFFFGAFLGPEVPPPLFLGVHQPLFDWGALIGAQGSRIMYPWMLLAPALALGICVLGFTLVGEALRSLLE